ncbi:MAG: hypothetical protein OSB29_10650 [Verrucomicrobiota bacterium]|nr:hypothetical protein [Verrucomicrobiota bacterium]
MTKLEFVAEGEHFFMKFTAVYKPAPEGGFVAWLEEMPNLQTQDETMAEAKNENDPHT